MASLLRRTWMLLALAFFVIVPVAVLTLSRYSSDVFPRCRGTIEEAGDASPPEGDTSTYDPLDADRGGFRLHLDTMESESGQVTWAKIVRMETDDSGAPRECGGSVLRDQGVSNRGGALWPQPDGTLLYVDRRWHVEGSAFRAVERPTRHLQRGRLVARRHLPAMVALLAMVALGVAALRARRGLLYATKIHAWLEARIEPSGRIESESGETLGVVADDLRREAGPILVSPSARELRGIYRELPILARQHVALGSHARWRDATMRALRDARVLATVSAACSAVALAASRLGG